MTALQTSSVRSRLPRRANWPACGLTIGSFDGVHLGHQAVVSELVRQCQHLGIPSSVLTFYPRPAQYFAGEDAAPSLMGWREKVGSLAQLGPDQVICTKFDQHICGLSAQAFVEEVVVGSLNARLVMIGDDFRFGADRGGDYELLKVLGAKYGFTPLRSPTLEQGGARVSSSRIRAELAQGNLASARQLLGRDYSIQGRVVAGRQIGRQLGVPTANIPLSKDRLTIRGVFVVEARLESGAVHQGVANLGYRPAVGQSDHPLLEVHLLDFSENLYGRRLCVSFLQKIRDEQHFATYQALEQQIRADMNWARQWLAQQTRA